MVQRRKRRPELQACHSSLGPHDHRRLRGIHRGRRAHVLQRRTPGADAEHDGPGSGGQLHQGARVGRDPIDGPTQPGPAIPLTLKSCNRCGRFLPVNTDNERNHPSLSNHCARTTGDHASTPGWELQPADGVGDVLELDYGFQLECRFCKKFEVNAAHNPRRTAAQMKEDGARRRGFELLLTALYGESDSLLYRKRTGGRELVDDVYKRFGDGASSVGSS